MLCPAERKKVERNAAVPAPQTMAMAQVAPLCLAMINTRSPSTRATRQAHVTAKISTGVVCTATSQR